MKNLILTTLLLVLGTSLAIAQNAFYKNNFLYAHTFENGLNDGIYKNPATMDCITYVGMTSPSTGGPDPKVPAVSAESTGAINSDTSFDGGLNARCFPQTTTNEVVPTGCGSSGIFFNNFGLTFNFAADANPYINGLYFEAGQVNMSGLFQVNSVANYRVVVHEGDLCGPELFNSEILSNEDLWNKFYIPFEGVNTLDWAGKTITFEIRFWNNEEGHPFFRIDDVALIGNTSCSPELGNLGNLIWNDSNQNGVKDSAESGIANVCLQLYADDGDSSLEFNGEDILVSSTVSGADGTYSFPALPDYNYYVVVCPNNFDQGEVLEPYFPTTGTSVSGDSDTDNTDHGVNSTSYKIYGVGSSIITLTAGAEPTIDGNDANGNLTIDFGFYAPPTVSLGNQVWEEVEEDGIFDANGADNILGNSDDELGIPNVILKLYKDNDGSQDLNAGDEFVEQRITDANGNYLFPYLLPDNYIVVIGTENFEKPVGSLEGYVITRAGTPTDPDDNTNNDNEGEVDGYKVVSKAITLSLGNEPTNDGDTDNNTNLTVDFGFYLCQAVGGEIKWQETYQGANNDNFHSITPTSDGGYIATLRSNSTISGDKTEASADDDVWVIKIDAVGNIQWQQTLKSTSTDIGEDIIETTDGGYFIAAYTLGSTGNDMVDASNGNYDIWAIKLDAAGNVEWDNAIGGNYGDYAYATRQTSDNGYIIAGASFSNAGGDKTVASTSTTYDWWIVKLTSAGAVSWDLTYGGAGSEKCRGIVENADGTFLAVGNMPSNSFGTGNVTITGKGSTDLGLLHISATGSIISEKAIGGSGAEVTQYASINSTSDGGALISTNSYSDISGDKTENSLGNTDYWIVKVDASGNVVWDKTLGGPGIDIAMEAKETSDGEYVVTGYSSSGAGGDKANGTEGSYDYWTIKLDASRNIIWENEVGGAGSDLPLDMLLLPNGNVLVAGQSGSGMNGDKDEGLLGSLDAWLVELWGKTSSCGDAAPGGDLAIGNLIWEDSDNNGTFNGAETGIDKVYVDLYVDDGDGVFESGDDFWVQRDSSDGSGSYLFDNIPADNYFVKISPDNFQGGGPLDGMCNSQGVVTSNSDTNDRDHGTDTQQAGQFGVVSSIVTLTEMGEPINDGDTDNNTNLSIDFGFYSPPSVMKIGNLVFEDKNNNSFLDAGEMGIPNVTVELYKDADGNEMLDTSKDTYVGNDITDASGIYGFENLAPGKYFLNIPASNWSGSLSGMKNSTAFGGNDFDNDNDDAGVEEMHYDEENQGVASSVLTLEYNAEPDVAVDGDDKFGNMSVDFGFYQEVKIGNLVWEDTDNDGIKSGTENPIGGIIVDLFVDSDKDGKFDKNTDAFYWSTFTDAVTGEYEFDRLGEDDYFVRVNPRNFKEGKPLRELMTSIVSVNGNSDTDENNHGTDYDSHQMEGVRSTVVTLIPTNEPTTDGDDDSSNSTVDFGFVPSRICGVAWEDVNEDGLFDGGDSHLEGVTVKLIEDPSGKVLDVTTTAADGTYSFGVSTGSYIIEFDETTNKSGIVFGSGTNQNRSGATLTDMNDSDIDLMTGQTIAFVFDTGDQDCNIDAGFSRNPLPVDMLYFRAHENDCVAELRWATASEENNSHFIIEKSDDGSRFTEIGRVEGAGNSVETIKYEFFDKDMTAEKMYYRIKQVDFDGTYTYTDVEVVKLGRNSKCLTELGKGLLYPNPNRGQFTFQIELDNALSGTVFSIIDILGREVYTQQQNLIEGENQISFDLDNYSGGTYFLSVKGTDGNEVTYRFILVDED